LEHVTDLLLDEDWDELRALYRTDDIAQKSLDGLINRWKAQSQNDQKLFGQTLLNDTLVVSSCIKRSNRPCKTKKTIVADFHLRAMLVGRLQTLPDTIRFNRSDHCRKLTAQHDMLIQSGGYYYLIFHIELKQHYGTQDKIGWTPGDREWQIYRIESWPL